MAIPTGYTLDTFSEWLTTEIFFEDTVELGIGDLREEAPDSYKELIFTGNGTFVPDIAEPPSGTTYNFNILPSPFVFEQNEELTLENGMVLRVRSTTDRDLDNSYAEDSIVTYGDTVLPCWVIANPNGASVQDGMRLRKVSVSGSTRIVNPVIETIMGFTLAQMGLNDISAINTSNMYTFRRIAVVEALKVIMQNKVSNYPILNAEDGSNYYGGTIGKQIRDFFEMEDVYLRDYLNNLDTTQDSRMNILEEGLSSNSGIGVVW